MDRNGWRRTAPVGLRRLDRGHCRPAPSLRWFAPLRTVPSPRGSGRPRPGVAAALSAPLYPGGSRRTSLDESRTDSVCEIQRTSAIRLQRCRGSRISALNTLAKTIVGRSRGRRSAQNATTTARWRPRPTRRTAQHTLSYGRALRGAADAPSGVQHQWQQWLAAASRASRGLVGFPINIGWVSYQNVLLRILVVS